MQLERSVRILSLLIDLYVHTDGRLSGIIRCAAYSSAVNRPLHTPEDDARYEESSIAHFHDKLLRIKDRIKTVEGRRLSEERHEFVGTIHSHPSVKVLTELVDEL